MLSVQVCFEMDDNKIMRIKKIVKSDYFHTFNDRTAKNYLEYRHHDILDHL